MGDPTSSSVNYSMSTCRALDQSVDIRYCYNDLYGTPVADVPFEVVSKSDPAIMIKGSTDAEGKARAEGLPAGDVDVNFYPHSDAAERIKAAELRRQLSETLDGMVAEAAYSTQMQEQVWQETGLIEKGVIYAGALGAGVGDTLSDYGEMLAAVGGFLAQAEMAYLDFLGDIVTGDIKSLQGKLEQARAAGMDLADASAETAENLFLLLSDEETRTILQAFPEQYWDALSGVDKVRTAGAIGSDIVIGILIAAATGGAGGTAVGGKLTAQGGQKMAKVVDLMSDLLTQLKKTKAKQKLGGSTGNTTDGRVDISRSNNPLSKTHSGDSARVGRNGNGDACPNSSSCTLQGEPISMVTGEEMLEQVDFTLPGIIPFTWKRFYRTSNARNRGLGFGWTFPLSETLQPANDLVLYHDSEGRTIEFPKPAVGQFSRNSAEGLFLHCEWHNLFVLKQPGRPDKVFSGGSLITGKSAATLRLTSLIDVVGNRWDCFYNPDTQLIERMEASWGSELFFEHNEQLQISRIREGQHTLVSYFYDDQRDLIAVADAGGDAEQFAYQNHIITRRTLRSGFSFHFQWNQTTPQARCLRQWGDDLGEGAVYDYRFEWWPEQRISRAYDSFNHCHEYHYNDQGLVEREIDPLGHETRHEYDRNGRKIRTVDALGNEERFQYNRFGHLASHTRADGSGINQLYDLQGRPIAYIDSEGNRWQRQYDDKGLVNKTIDAEGHEVRYYYNEQGLPQLIIDPEGNRQVMAWDDQGRLQTRALGSSANPDQSAEPVHYYYNERGQVAAQEQQGQHTRYQYDIKGDVVAIHAPNGGETRLQYNANRQLTAYTDPLGRTTRFEYDGLAQIVRRIQPDGHSLHYHYDRERNLIGLTNEKGERYQLKYDANERLIEEIGFDGRMQRYEYNPLGHLIAYIDGLDSENDSNTTRFKRDPLGRLLHKHTPDGFDTTFRYNRNGRLTQAVNRNRTLAFQYNRNGRLIQESQDQAELKHEYNALGQRIGSTLPGGESLQYQFDPQGQFIGLDYNGQCITDIQRNGLGLETGRKQGNNLSGSEYDLAGRLTRHWVQQQAQREAIIDRQYHYDGAGRLQQINDLRKGLTQYHYDALDRLTQVEGYASEQFDFDPAGNLLDSTSEQGGVDAGNRLRFHGDRHFQYDDRGNLTEERRGTGGKLCTRYTYNSQNQLVQVEKNGQTFHYTYDPLGRRASKTDAFGETSFLWNGDVLLSESRNHQEKLYLYEPNSFRPLAFIENNQCYFYQNDHLGTPQELTDWEGRVVWSVRYKVYGNVIRKDVEQVENNLRFQGQYFDAETGLHYNRFRYYDPGTGEFTQQDPIGLLGGINNYRYAANPVGWIDPFGLTCKEGVANVVAASLLVTAISTHPVQATAPELIEPPQETFAEYFWERTKSGEVRDDIFRTLGAYAKIGAGSITMVGGWALKNFNPVVGGYMMVDGSSIYAGGISEFSNQLYGTDYDADFMKYAYRDAAKFYGGTEQHGDMARAGTSLLTIAGAWTTKIPTVVAGGEWGTSALTHTKTVNAVTKASGVELANDAWAAKDSLKEFAPEN